MHDTCAKPALDISRHREYPHARPASGSTSHRGGHPKRSGARKTVLMTAGFKDPDLRIIGPGGVSAADLVAMAADLSMVIDGKDIIRDIANGLGDALSARLDTWRGKSVESVVDAGSRPALKRMLRAVRSGGRPGRFDLVHELGDGEQLSIQYGAAPIGGDSVILIGRDTGPLADLRARLIDNRQTLEERAAQQRQAEAQYRLIFEAAAEAMAIIDAGTGRIRDANSRAVQMLGGTGRINGRKLTTLLTKASRAAAQAMLAQVQASGAPARASVEGFDSGAQLELSAELFRAGDLRLMLLKIADAAEAQTPTGEAALVDLVRDAPEGVLLTDSDGRIQWVNEAFLALAQVPVAARVLGRPIDDFFSWSTLELDVLFANAHRHGQVPRVEGTVRGALGQTVDVELSVIDMPQRVPPGYGIVMRPRAEGGERGTRAGGDLTSIGEDLIALIGKVPMKDLVRDATDVLERMCIEAALRLTGNNRASAARVLGLSRQALYLKLDRYGIDDA